LSTLAYKYYRHLWVYGIVFLYRHSGILMLEVTVPSTIRNSS
jgi:hypothetical protein